MATIRDVAQKAGVGIATVSRVLSENGYVKEETSLPDHYDLFDL